MRFLRHFAGDWKGTDLKVALSQTIFCNLANYHGGGQQYLVADWTATVGPKPDAIAPWQSLGVALSFTMPATSTWPPSLGTGSTIGGTPVFLCVPSIAAGYPRSWLPDKEGRPVRNRPEPGLPNTGEYKDGLANKLSVFAIGNPAARTARAVLPHSMTRLPVLESLASIRKPDRLPWNAGDCLSMPPTPSRPINFQVGPRPYVIPITMAGTGRTSAEHRDHGDEEPGHSGQGLRGKLVYALRSGATPTALRCLTKRQLTRFGLANRTASFGKP